MKHLRTFESYNNENTSTSKKKPIHYLVHFSTVYDYSTYFDADENGANPENERRCLLKQRLGGERYSDQIIDKMEYINTQDISDNDGDWILADDYRAILTPEELREFCDILGFIEAKEIDKIEDEKADSLDRIYEQEEGYVRAVVFENESEGVNPEEDAAHVTPIFSQDVKNELNEELNKYSEEQRKVIEQRIENKFDEILNFLYSDAGEIVSEGEDFPEFMTEMNIDVPTDRK